MAASPPESMSTIADNAKMIPYVYLTMFAGSKLPFVVILPNTNVAESADVTKNVVIKNNVMKLKQTKAYHTDSLLSV